jgi:hypothetical protein
MRVAVGGGTVGVAVGGVVGMGVGVKVAGGLGVLVGVGVGSGELQPLRKGSRTSPLMMQRQRKTFFLEAVFAPIMIVLTSGERFRMAGYIIAHLPQLDHFCLPALNLGNRFDNKAIPG